MTKNLKYDSKYMSHIIQIQFKLIGIGHITNNLPLALVPIRYDS